MLMFSHFYFLFILSPGQIVPHECATRSPTLVAALLDPMVEQEFYLSHKYEGIKQEVKPCPAEVNSKTPGWYPGFGFECS